MSLEPCPRVLVGGTLIDGTGRPPIKDSVVVVKGDWIIAVGKRGKVEIPEGSEVYDVSGMTVLPGLIDSHCHFQGMGVALTRMVNLRDTESLADAMEKVKQRAMDTPKGEWVLGKAWDESKWPENRYITRYDLDEISTDHPIYLARVCGHLVSVNSLALELAEITKDTPSPSGGQIDKSEDGEPTGILRECRYLIERVVPPVTDEARVEGLKKACEHALSLGCTSIHDAGSDAPSIRAYQTALQEGKLTVRSYIMPRGEAPDSAYGMGIKTGFGNKLLRIGPTKLLIDGSLGARTAALFEPYSDEPSTKGLLVIEPEELTEKVKEAHLNGCQAAVHAIGDRGIEHSINSIQEALREAPRKDHRHRIEHCEVLTAQQIERIKELGIVPAMQPNFIGEWSGPGSMYEARLGRERERLSNPYRILLDEGITVCFGSDGMPFNPIYGIWSAVNHPIRSSRITLEEAVRCYTLNSAYASFEEDLKGSVEAGKLADIAVFDRDLTEIPREEIRDAEAYMTIVNGNILYHRGLE